MEVEEESPGVYISMLLVGSLSFEGLSVYEWIISMK